MLQVNNFFAVKKKIYCTNGESEEATQQLGNIKLGKWSVFGLEVKTGAVNQWWKKLEQLLSKLNRWDGEVYSV